MSDNWNTLRPQLEYISRPFPQSAIDFANQHRDEVAPFLIESLNLVTADLSVTADGRYMLHLFAIHLLASWRDQRAYAPMLAFGHFSEEILDGLIGDTVTESYGRCLASVWDGNHAPLKAIFEDTQASYWARGAALDAWVVLVWEGDSARGELLQYLISRGDAEAARLRQDNVEIDALEVLDCIVAAATGIAANEMLERIEGWFADGLLDVSIADWEWTQEEIGLTFEVLRKRGIERGQGYVSDVAKEMSWWAGFQEEKMPKPSSVGMAYPSLVAESHGNPVRLPPKIGRNEPCHCGSGKKYKKCHGAG